MALILFTTQLADQDGAYSGFHSMRLVNGNPPSPGCDARILSGFPNSLLVPICTPGWREAL